MGNLTDRESSVCKRMGLCDEVIDWVKSAPSAAILVGEAPTRRSGDSPLLPWPPGSVGDRLRTCVGLGRDTYLAMVDRANLIDHRTGVRWPVEEARRSARILCALAVDQDLPLILVGPRVAEAFGVADRPLFSWDLIPGGPTVVRLPPATGPGRTVNDNDMRGLTARVFSEAFRRRLRHLDETKRVVDPMRSAS